MLTPAHSKGQSERRNEQRGWERLSSVLPNIKPQSGQGAHHAAATEPWEPDTFKDRSCWKLKLEEKRGCVQHQATQRGAQQHGQVLWAVPWTSAALQIPSGSRTRRALERTAGPSKPGRQTSCSLQQRHPANNAPIQAASATAVTRGWFWRGFNYSGSPDCGHARDRSTSSRERAAPQQAAIRGGGWRGIASSGNKRPSPASSTGSWAAWGWQGPLGPPGLSPAPAGPPRAGSTGPQPGGFRSSPRRPHHLSGQHEHHLREDNSTLREIFPLEEGSFMGNHSKSNCGGAWQSQGPRETLSSWTRPQNWVTGRASGWDSTKSSSSLPKLWTQGHRTLFIRFCPSLHSYKAFMMLYQLDPKA